MNIIARLLSASSVRARLLGACCGLSVLSALVVGAEIRGFATMSAAVQRAVDENLPSVSHLVQADRDVSKLVVGQDSTDAREAAIDVSLDDDAATSNARAVEARTAATRWWIFVGIGAALASALTVSLVLARSIARPLADTVELPGDAMKGDGTFTTDASQQRSGAVGQLASGTEEQPVAPADEFKHHLVGESTAGTGGKKRHERRKMRAEDPSLAEFIEALTVKGTNGHTHGNGHL